jgi:alkanesulfonate monooxygenase SsuD/methylene tetrahydromethanopterin reductase-like flavin-dependent oxidoreductase (luciferase family)
LSRKVRYLHRDRRFINLDDAIPFYVAANGPRMLGLAGEFGDGIITTGVATPERLQAVFRHAQEGARRAGRELTRRLPCVSLTQVMVIRPGEALDSPRVMQMVGPWVITCLHAIAAGYAKPRSLPADARKVYDAYADYIANLPGQPEEHYLELHNGHCTFVPERERRFVTPETIRATTLIGERAQVIEQLKALERAGLDQIILNPPMDGFEEYVTEFAREVIERM